MDPATGAMHETQAVLRDIGDRVDAQLSMERQALTDPLTGLANRTLLSDRLSHALRHLKRNAGLVGLLMLDLDHFKVINDTLGHEVGDAVLVEDPGNAGARLAGRGEHCQARAGNGGEYLPPRPQSGFGDFVEAVERAEGDEAVGERRRRISRAREKMLRRVPVCFPDRR